MQSKRLALLLLFAMSFALVLAAPTLAASPVFGQETPQIAFTEDIVLAYAAPADTWRLQGAAFDEFALPTSTIDHRSPVATTILGVPGTLDSLMKARAAVWRQICAMHATDAMSVLDVEKAALRAS